jgi:uncharacterized Tic20 family protein
MTSFPPHRQSQRPAASADVPDAGPAAHAPSRTAPGPGAGPPGGDWRTGPDEDWHTGRHSAVSPAPQRDQSLAVHPAGPAVGGPAGGAPGGWPDPDLAGGWAAAGHRLPGDHLPGDHLPSDYLPGDQAADDPAESDQAAADRAPDAISRPARDGDEAWAMLGYLGVPFISVLAPLTVILVRARSSDYVRQHATQALNLSITLALYNFCALIVAAMLALDAVGVALAVAVPAALVLWLVTLGYLVRAAMRASLGEFYRLPRWICATIAH